MPQNVFLGPFDLSRRLLLFELGLSKVISYMTRKIMRRGGNINVRAIQSH
jgi:hypothetical protein